jgi:hypothetical protein
MSVASPQVRDSFEEDDGPHDDAGRLRFQPHSFRCGIHKHTETHTNAHTHRESEIERERKSSSGTSLFWGLAGGEKGRA